MGRASTHSFPGRRFLLLHILEKQDTVQHLAKRPFTVPPSPTGQKSATLFPRLKMALSFLLAPCKDTPNSNLRGGKERAPRPYFHRAKKGEVRAKEKVRVTGCTGGKEKGSQRMKLCRMFHKFRSLEGTEHQKGGKAFLLSLSLSSGSNSFAPRKSPSRPPPPPPFTTCAQPRIAPYSSSHDPQPSAVRANKIWPRSSILSPHFRAYTQSSTFSESYVLYFFLRMAH